MVCRGVEESAVKSGIEKSICRWPPPQPPSAVSAAIIASEEQYVGSAETSCVQGSGCSKIPPVTGAPEPAAASATEHATAPELLAPDPLEAAPELPEELLLEPLLEPPPDPLLDPPPDPPPEVAPELPAGDASSEGGPASPLDPDPELVPHAH